jgi:hypothetical protein
MAKRKRRKSAGPPPVPASKKAPDKDGAGSAVASVKRKPGEPLPATLRGVLIRAGIVATVFYPYLVYVIDEEPWTALGLTAIAFALMVPLGLFLDRLRYRRQMRRWEERRARPKPTER